MLEYNVLAAQGIIPTQEMNKLGEEGWELVTIIPVPTRVNTIQFIYTFKRFKQIDINVDITAKEPLPITELLKGNTENPLD